MMSLEVSDGISFPHSRLEMNQVCTHALEPECHT
jgi:hypothetical protein